MYNIDEKENRDGLEMEHSTGWWLQASTGHALGNLFPATTSLFPASKTDTPSYIVNLGANYMFGPSRNCQVCLGISKLLMSRLRTYRYQRITSQPEAKPLSLSIPAQLL
jgi:hypothetical protein